jgi:hypothetical protein
MPAESLTQGYLLPIGVLLLFGKRHHGARLPEFFSRVSQLTGASASSELQKARRTLRTESEMT